MGILKSSVQEIMRQIGHLIIRGICAFVLKVTDVVKAKNSYK